MLRTMRFAKKNRRWLVCWALLFLAGCNSTDGTDPYATWKGYQSPDELYRFYYLSPPWEKDLRQRQGSPVYVIDPNDNPLPVRGMPGDGIGARISLEVEVVWDTTVQEASEADLAAWEAEGAIAEPSEQFENRAGDVGLRVFVEATDRWITAAYFGLDGNGVVAMKIAGNDDDLQSDDMILLLRGLEPITVEGD